MFDQDKGEQGQALGGLVHLGAHLFGDEIVEATAVADQLVTQGLEQGAILILLVGQLGVQLRVAAADVITLEQLAEDRRQLGEFFQVNIHRAVVPAGLIKAKELRLT
ncbi:hypothetical protein D9M68_803910 [compost metagenome]